jgi:hypothetical protein
MDDETLDYIDHFRTLSIVDQLEILNALVGHASNSEILPDNTPGILQFVSSLEATCRTIRTRI